MSRPTAVPRSVPRSLSPHERWLEEGQAIVARRESALWDLGDHLVAAPDEADGAPDAELAERLGATPGLLRTARWIARRFPAAVRRKGPRFGPSHHLEVAALPDEVALPLLDAALEEGWTVMQLRFKAREAAANRKVEELAAARQRTELSADFGTHSRHVERDCQKAGMEVAAALRSMSLAVRALAAHPGRGAVHGNRVRGIAERLRAVFGGLQHVLDEFAADDHLACLLSGGTA